MLYTSNIVPSARDLPIILPSFLSVDILAAEGLTEGLCLPPGDARNSGAATYNTNKRMEMTCRDVNKKKSNWISLAFCLHYELVKLLFL